MQEFLQYEIFGLATMYQVMIIIHLLGLALGAGGALFSDFLFTSSLKDKKIDKTEYRILKLDSQVIWLGLAILVTSGLVIFSGNVDRLLDSSKFLAKVTIVSIIILNGITFHFYQIPLLRKIINKDLSKHKTFMQKHAKAFFIGGAISGTSWVAALVLGSLRSVDLAYAQIMAIYAGVLVLAIAFSLRLKSRILG